MLGEDLDAASAGYRVGYGDASHFTREYKRLFDAPPVRDVERLREAAREAPAYEPIGAGNEPARLFASIRLFTLAFRRGILSSVKPKRSENKGVYRDLCLGEARRESPGE